VLFEQLFSWQLMGQP